MLALAAGTMLPTMATRAQQSGSMPVVGMLALAQDDRAVRLRESLRKLGYQEGRTVRLLTAGDRHAALAQSASEFVRQKVNVIVAIGTTATVAASKATSTIPIVMIAGVDPVKERLVASLSRPGGNITGVSTIVQELVPKRLELAKEAVPGLARVGILWNPDSRGSTNALAQARQAAKTLQLDLQVVEARSPGEFDKAFEALAKSRTRIFVWLPAGSTNREQLLSSATKHRLAGVFSSADWADAGGLIAYGPSESEPYQHAAAYVDRILKGAKPGDLPIEQPTKLELVVNLKTAKALAFTIPRSILVRTDRTIQ